ncbi:MAG: hypothetical protein M3R02_01980 [Chloroflexota bacterium]|nr:hypothetical protein [Chloroflexota bacterium]
MAVASLARHHGAIASPTQLAPLRSFCDALLACFDRRDDARFKLVDALLAPRICNGLLGVKPSHSRARSLERRPDERFRSAASAPW